MDGEAMLGHYFEREIREQPELWRSLAHSSKARAVAEAISGREIILIGSGSSLFVAELGAIALRHRGVRAHAIAATEAAIDHAIYSHATAIVCSQSGQSADVLKALDLLRPRTLIAITNTPDSPLGRHATLCIDVECGAEIAVPASKTVTVMAATLLWAAAMLHGGAIGSAAALWEASDAVQSWLDNVHPNSISEAAMRISKRSSAVIVGSGFGLPVAREIALKIKEASYMHAEGFAAGEFRHGSAAMLDASCAIAGILDGRSDELVRRALQEASNAEALAYAVGELARDLPVLGPVFAGPFAPLGWIVAGQVLALHLGRARGVQSDAPRGLVKAIV